MTNTPQINLKHPRIKARTPEQQRYRNRLAENLKADRQLGEIGKLLAENTLQSAQKGLDYELAKYGFTQKGLDVLIKAKKWEFIFNNLNKFQGLDNEVAKALIEAGE